MVSIRTVYGIFDFLSEMGGLISIWMPLASFLLKLLQIPRLYPVSLIKKMVPVIRKKNTKLCAQVEKFKNKFSEKSN